MSLPVPCSAQVRSRLAAHFHATEQTSPTSQTVAGLPLFDCDGKSAALAAGASTNTRWPLLSYPARGSSGPEPDDPSARYADRPVRAHRPARHGSQKFRPPVLDTASLLAGSLHPLVARLRLVAKPFVGQRHAAANAIARETLSLRARQWLRSLPSC